MGAYTPGLKVTEATLLHLERRLPLDGEVVVEEGARVEWNQVVARTELPGKVDMVNVANILGVDAGEVRECLFKTEGEPVEKGEPLGQNQGFFGLFKSTVRATMSGTVESVSDVTGQVVLRSPPEPVEIRAYVDGVVEKVLPGQGVVVKTFGTFIQGIFGIGGETSGALELVTDDPAREMRPQDIGPQHQGKLLVGGSLVTKAVIDAALEHQVAGIIVGGLHDQDLRDFLGYDLGVAITGSERKGLTLIITEGFGPIQMADRTFALFRANQGRRASISGATQIRAGVIRPEVIIPRLEGDWEEARDQPLDLELAVGVPVRIIREPGFGQLARVTALPVEPAVIPTGARVRVAEIELKDGRTLTIPRANLELIEG